MDKLSLTEFMSARTVKRKFMQWAWKWFYANTPESISEKPDVTSLICLLQVIGFQLRKFEKSTVDDDKNDEVKENNVTVIIKCGTSKMQAILELNEVKCHCPNDRETIDASFWSVSGIGSIDNINKLIETGSNLVPRIDKDTSNMVHDIIYHILSIINPKLVTEDDSDLTLNTVSTEEDSKLNLCYDTAPNNNDPLLTRCYTQPEIVSHRRHEQKQDFPLSNLNQLSTSDRRMSISTQNLSQTTPLATQGFRREKTPVLLREKTWDKSCEDEPRPSPPKSSTPSHLNDLCSSLGEVSLRSDDLGMSSLAECLQKAKFYIEKAQKLQKTSDDDVFLKPSTPPWGNSPRKANRSPVRPPGSRCTSPSLSVKSLPQKPIIRKSIGGSITKLQSGPSMKFSPTTKLLSRGRSLGGTSPAIKNAVDNAQKKVIAARLEPLQPSKRTLGSSSTSLNTSAFTTSSTVSNNGDVKTSIKRYSITGTGIKSSTIPKKKISTDANDVPQSSSTTRTLKPRIPTNNPIQKDKNIISPAKLTHSTKK